MRDDGTIEYGLAVKKINQVLGWWINREGKREWTECGDPVEEKATAAEVRAYELLISMQQSIIHTAEMIAAS
jgi:hypothetical protein